MDCTEKLLFAGGLPANNFLFARGPPKNNFLFARGPPSNNFLFAGGPPSNKFLFSGGSLENNLFHNKIINPIISAEIFCSHSNINIICRLLNF